MAKSEMYGNSLIPLVLVAGILSGGLWRSNAPAESGKSGESSRSSTSDKSDAGHAPVPWISDLRPVLESLDDALGGQADSAGASPLVESATVALADKGAARDQEVLQAMAGLRTGLDGLSTSADATTCGGAVLEEHARVRRLDARGRLGWRYAAAAEARALLDEYRDVRRPAAARCHRSAVPRSRRDVVRLA
jgi:hypothetical protein